MLRRLYVHNFRCLENFELAIGSHPSALLIGKNGAGKSTVGSALEIFQRLARGTNRVGDLIQPKDLTRGRLDLPVRLEIEADISDSKYTYSLALEFHGPSKELRVFDEILKADGSEVYSRQRETVELPRRKAKFELDSELIALSLLQEKEIFQFTRWLSRMVILQPLPVLMRGESDTETLELAKDARNFGAWFSGVLASAPAAYAEIDRYLHEVMPDFKDIQNPTVGSEARRILVQFATPPGSLSLSFDELSDGEKCFLLCAVVLAANRAYGPLFCFWDEPDNYLALSEVGHFIGALRREFQSKGQFITTSHHPEAIRRFSDENTFLIFRRSHLEPAVIRPLSEIPRIGDVVTAMLLGDLEHERTP